jgi:hypothetical protein
MRCSCAHLSHKAPLEARPAARANRQVGAVALPSFVPAAKGRHVPSMSMGLKLRVAARTLAGEVSPAGGFAFGVGEEETRSCSTV